MDQRLLGTVSGKGQQMAVAEEHWGLLGRRQRLPGEVNADLVSTSEDDDDDDDDGDPLSSSSRYPTMLD